MVMRYTGMNRTTPRGVKPHVALIRTLRSYVEQHLSDLVDTNKFEPTVIDGADDRGRDDIVEAKLAISGQTFVFQIEGSDQSVPETIMPNGALGVVHEQSGMTVSGPLDAGIWQRIEALVRVASK
jgi:hypothetical protein